MDGSATLTIVESGPTMNRLMQQIARMSNRRLRLSSFGLILRHAPGRSRCGCKRRRSEVSQRAPTGQSGLGVFAGRTAERATPDSREITVTPTTILMIAV